MALAPRQLWEAFLAYLQRPADARGLAVFRMLFGMMMCFGALRFLHNGWVERFFGRPDYFFGYWGFDWLPTLGVDQITAAFWAMAVLAVMVACGFFYRFAIIAFAVLFTWVELLDVTNYLNHYYFVSLISVILAFLPANAKWSIDAWLRPSLARDHVPQLAYFWLRFQVAVVWVGAALAKFTTDWLLHAQPMNIWLNARVDTPIIGPYLDIWEVALVASWAGFLYDLTVPFLLMWRRTRPFAFVAVVGFHVMTHVWFTIGMFPLIMMVSATIFFAPGWPARLVAMLRQSGAGGPPAHQVEQDSPAGQASGDQLSGDQVRRGPAGRVSGDQVRRRPAGRVSGDQLSGEQVSRRHAGLRPAVVFVLFWCLLQVAIPLRFVAYGGNVLWHEQGMRWAWKVMCREKNGAVTLRVTLPSEGRTFEWTPRRWLTEFQEREMSGQPDMILGLAHDVADEFRARGYPEVEVRADAIASLNGRPPAPLIDPEVDLVEVNDGLAPADWIAPAPVSAPPKIGRTLFGSNR